MTITAGMIKELRERTGAGMMDCKKSLIAANGDMEAAIDELRKKGVAAVARKAGRIAAEGMIASARNMGAGAIVEINCETDFVARDNSFLGFANALASAVLEQSPADVEALNALEINGESVEAARQNLIAKIGENISIRRFERITVDGSAIGCYLHGSRIGVLVKVSGGSEELARDIAMHIAASRPLCISEDEMDAAVLEKEKAIFTAQAAASGKPADIVENMVSGRMRKFLEGNTLLGQPFVKNTDQTVAQLLEDAGATVVKMVRFEVGEGLEKKNEDFVAEVMAQVGT